jgi:multidrug efflux pump subunit AcrB
MITFVYILGAWCALSLIAAPVLIPMLARRFALRHKDGFTEPLHPREPSSVRPQVRMLRR